MNFPNNSYGGRNADYDQIVMSKFAKRCLIVIAIIGIILFGYSFAIQTLGVQQKPEDTDSSNEKSSHKNKNDINSVQNEDKSKHPKHSKHSKSDPNSQENTDDDIRKNNTLNADKSKNTSTISPVDLSQQNEVLNNTEDKNASDSNETIANLTQNTSIDSQIFIDLEIIPNKAHDQIVENYPVSSLSNFNMKNLSSMLIKEFKINSDDLEIKEDIEDFEQLTTDISYKVMSLEKNPGIITMTLTKVRCELENFIDTSNTDAKAANSLSVTILLLSRTEFSLKIKSIDSNFDQFEIPYESPYPYDKNNKTELELNDDLDYKIVLSKIDQDFFFVLVRQSTNEILFDTRSLNIGYFDKYKTLQAKIPNSNVFGFGERFLQFKLPLGKYTIWPKDQPFKLDNGRANGLQTYGCQPLFINIDSNNLPMLVLLRNSGPMDIEFFTEKNDHFLRYHVISGVLEYRFFVYESLSELILSYHKYLGGYTIPPFWAMGYQHSKWGWKNLDTLKKIVSGFDDNDIPLDVLYNDLDYMYGKIDFTVDEIAFPPNKVNSFLESENIKWVPIIDAGVSTAREPKKVIDKGDEWDVWIKDRNEKTIKGYVWPGDVHFVDFTHPKGSEFWQKGLDYLHDKIKYSGIWLDMNEVANFCDHVDCSPLGYPYEPSGNLRQMTIDPLAIHYNGIKELDLHSFFGFLQGKSTYEYMKQTFTKFPFILSRSNIFGSGKYVAHWTGDNKSSFDFLKISVGMNFLYNIFGIPMVGCDICGFGDSTDDNLCARWYQIGALYPFSRNHNILEGRDQEPWKVGKNSNASARESLKLRYSILHYYHSLFLLNNGTGMVYQPLFFIWLNDTKTIDDVQVRDQQFMIGDALMGISALDLYKDKCISYFPQGTWYSFKTGRKVVPLEKSPKYQEIECPLNSALPFFMRGGTVVYKQKTDQVTRVEHLEEEIHELVIAFEEINSDLLAAHSILIIIGDHNNEDLVEDCLLLYDCRFEIGATFDKKNNILSVYGESFDSRYDPEFLIESITFFGIELPPKNEYIFQTEDSTQIILEDDEIKTTMYIDKLIKISELRWEFHI